MKFFPSSLPAFVVFCAIGLVTLGQFPQAQGQDKAASPVAQTASAPQLVLQRGHTAYVGNVAVTPLGDFYATGDNSGIIKLWTRPQHDLLWTAASVGEGINSLQFSPDGSKLLASDGAGLWLWEVKSGNQLWHSSKGATALRFSPDSNSIVSISFDGTSTIFDLAGRVLSQTKRDTKFDSTLRNGVISPDARLLATDELVGEPEDRGVVYSASPIEIRRRLFIPREEAIRALDFSPDNTLLAVGLAEDSRVHGSRGLVKIFDVQTGHQLRGWEAYSGTGNNTRLEDIKFSPDGRSLMTLGQNDNSGADQDQAQVKVWDASTGALLHRITNSDKSRAQRFLRGEAAWISPSLIMLVAKNYNLQDLGVEEVDLTTDKKQAFLWTNPGQLSKPSWSPDGRYLVASGIASLSPLPKDPFELLPHYEIKGEQKIVSGPSTLRVWNRESGKWTPPPWQKEPTATTTFTPEEFDGRKSISYPTKADEGAGIEMWRWTPDSQTLVDGSTLLESWRWPSGPRNWADARPVLPPLPANATAEQIATSRIQVQTFRARYFGQVQGVEISNDNRTLALGTINPDYATASSRDPGPRGTLVLRDLQTRVLTELEAGPDVFGLAFSPDGKWLACEVSYLFASRRRANRLDIWDVAAHRKVASHPTSAEGDSFVGWLDNTHLLLGDSKFIDSDGTMSVTLQAWSFERNTFAPISLPIPADKYRRLQFNSFLDIQNSFLLARTDKEYLWFSLPGLQIVASMPNTQPTSINGLQHTPVLAPDATVAAIEGDDGTLQLWRTTRGKQQAELAATLALLSTPVGQAPDWVLWTPDSYYDCSPDAARWINWRQNGQLLPASAFANRRREGLLRQIAPFYSPLPKTQ